LNEVMVKNPSTSMITIPLEECTPLAVIPGNLSFTYSGLGIECVVVVVGEYYYSHKTKAIDKRMTKRKRGGVGASQETSERIIKWMAGPNPKENAIHAASALSAFVGANVISYYEVAEALDMSKVGVDEIEVAMDTIRDNVANDFKKEAMIA